RVGGASFVSFSAYTAYKIRDQIIAHQSRNVCRDWRGRSHFGASVIHQIPLCHIETQVSWRRR
ncbi:MAG: hypothetical protein AAGA67_01230, partial [Cyanobacteria bacterium P01_F01_bin.153]